MPRSPRHTTHALSAATLALLLVGTLLYGSRTASAADDCPPVSFNTAPTFPVGINPNFVADGDFNGDGIVDLAVSNESFNSNDERDVAILRGEGNGRFKVTNRLKILPEGFPPGFIAVGDFNKDGKADLAVTGVSYGDVYLFLSDGNGGFAPRATFAAGLKPNSMLARDLNGDGKLDLAVANVESQNISLLFGNGAGSFAPPVNLQLFHIPGALDAGDFNGDGKLDIIVAAAAGMSSELTTVLFGDGTGNYARQPIVNGATKFVKVADFNGDGKADIAGVKSSGGLLIRLGNGEGSFPVIKEFAAQSPTGIEVADFNADGKLDLALSSTVYHRVTVMLGDGLGNFSSKWYAAGSHPSGITSHDFNLDGKADLAVVNNRSHDVSIMLGDGAGGFGASPHYASGQSAEMIGARDPNSIDSGDFNGDGRADLAVVNINSRNVAVLVNDGRGAFSVAARHQVGFQPKAVAVADVNRDGKADIVVGHQLRDLTCLTTLLGVGDGSFVKANNSGIGGTWNVDTLGGGSFIPAEVSYIATGDLNGDGQTDLALLTLNKVSLALSTGNGYEIRASFNGGSDSSAIALGDLNRDGKSDIIVTNASPLADSTGLTVAFSDGAGDVASIKKLLLGVGRSAAVVRDFNGDGHADIGVATPHLNFNEASVSLLLGDSSGNFPQTKGIGLRSQTDTIATGDFNGDGKLDLAGTGILNNVNVALGDGAGNFTDAASHGVGSEPRSFTVNDFNGDGKSDVATANHVAGDVTALVSTPCASVPPAPTHVVFGRVTDIAGNPLAGVKFTVGGAHGGASVSTESDEQGNYALNNSVGGDTLTPSKAGYVFSPGSVRAVSSIGIIPIDGAHDFTGGTTVYTLSGRIISGTGSALSGALVTVGGFPQPFVVPTDAGGNYSLSGLFAGGTYTVTPSYPGHVFNPSSVRFSNLSASAVVNTFVGTTKPYNISGQIRDEANNPLSGVTMTLSRVGGAETLALATDANGNYTFRNVAGEAAYTVTPTRAGYAFNPPSATLTNPSGNQVVNFNAAVSQSKVQFSQANYMHGEGDPLGFVNVTVVRTGDSSAALTVNYATSDTAGLVSCDPLQSGQTGKASERCDYSTSVGTLRWTAGDASAKTFTVPVVDDRHAEGNETFNLKLSAPTGAILGSIDAATVTLLDDESAPAASNPIDDPGFFIRQQYLDFLGRSPDGGGFANWMTTLGACPGGGFGTSNPTCDRIHIAKSTFQSEEFQTRGYWAYRFYEVAFGRRPSYAEFTPDMATVGGSKSPQEEALSKEQYTAGFILRQEFTQRYGALSDPAHYVDALLITCGLQTLASRGALVEALRSGQKSRGQVLREIVEATEVEAKFYTRGFVSMMYYGFLRRDPDAVGFDNYVRKLDAAWDPRAVTFDFIYSTEYLGRFGKP